MGKYLIDETTLTGIADAIREKSGKLESIPVTNYATEIANLPTGGLPVLYEGYSDVRVVIDYTLNPVEVHDSSGWQYLQVFGFEVKNDKIEHYFYRLDVDEYAGANGTIEFNACLNTGLEITCMGWSPYDSFFCDIMKVEVKYEDSEEYEWQDVTTSFAAIPANPEEKYIYIPTVLGGGSPYKAIRITVLGSPPSGWA